jgi:hypothetical protein
VRQVERLVDAGVSGEVAGRAVGCSRRSVCRVLARRRARPEPTLAELLAPYAGDDYDPLAIAAERNPRSPVPPLRRRPSWMRAAERAERLEAERLDGDDPA